MPGAWLGGNCAERPLRLAASPGGCAASDLTLDNYTNMKTTTSLKSLAALTLLPIAALAQTSATPTAEPAATDRPGFWGTTAAYTTIPGTREFTIGASGATNKDLDDSFGGVAFSFGQYINETLMVGLRQSLNYNNPDVGGTEYNGSTKIAIDQHLTAHGIVRPFIGANFGRIYGDSVRDTWAAGLEAGAKFYVQERTFIVATVEYGWLFQHSDSIDNTFDDGQLNWSIGVGFNF